MAKSPISRAADTVGDGTGTKNAIGNYAITPQIFRIKPGADEIFEVTRMIPFLKDVGSIDSGAYGNGITLTNGITIQVIKFAGEANEEIVWDITEGLPIIVNPDWQRLCFDSLISSYGIGDETATWRYTFEKDGTPVILSGANGEEIQITLNDNFTGLIEHYFRFGINDIS